MDVTKKHVRIYRRSIAVQRAERRFAWIPVRLHNGSFHFWKPYIRWRERIAGYAGDSIEVRRYLEDEYFVELLLGNVLVQVA